MYDKKLGLIDKKVSGQYREYFFKGYRIWKRPLFSKVYCRKNNIFSKYDCIYLLNANIGEIYLFLKFYFSKVEKENLLNNKKLCLLPIILLICRLQNYFQLKTLFIRHVFLPTNTLQNLSIGGKSFLSFLTIHIMWRLKEISERIMNIISDL